MPPLRNLGLGVFGVLLIALSSAPATDLLPGEFTISLDPGVAKIVGGMASDPQASAKGFDKLQKAAGDPPTLIADIAVTGVDGGLNPPAAYRVAVLNPAPGLTLQDRLSALPASLLSAGTVLHDVQVGIQRTPPSDRPSKSPVAAWLAGKVTVSPQRTDLFRVHILDFRLFCIAVTAQFPTGNAAVEEAIRELDQSLTWRGNACGLSTFTDLPEGDLFAHTITQKSPATPDGDSEEDPVWNSAATNPGANDSFAKHRGGILLLRGDEGAGSGFVASMDGRAYAITNIHVVAAMSKIEVLTPSKDQIRLGAAAAAVGHDILRVETDTLPGIFEILEDLDSVAKIGDPVAIIGNPSGAGVVRVTPGELLGIGPELVEVSAKFIPGNSGSPIVHIPSGKVIGVATYLIERDTEDTSEADFGGEKIRRFGFRIDSVSTWQPIEWSRFQAEAKRDASMDENTIALIKTLRSMGEGNLPRSSSLTNPTLRKAIDAYVTSMSRVTGISDNDRRLEEDRILSALRSVAKSDLPANDDEFTYDYFRRRLTDTRKVRSDIFDFLDRLKRSRM